MNIEIALDEDKDPYIKTISGHPVINLTGESGSGKSYYTKEYMNNDDYIIIDFDNVFKKNKMPNIEEKKLKEKLEYTYGENFRESLFSRFDEYYEFVLNFFENSGRILIIDSAQLRNISDISKLKGTVIVIITCINTCYKRCIDRYDSNYPDATIEDRNAYMEKKRKIFEWYHSMNKFLINLDKF